MSVVTLVSGGIDSAVLALLAKSEGVTQFPTFIDYGQLARDREWEAVLTVCRRYDLPTPTRMDLSGFGACIPSALTSRDKDPLTEAFLPGRNALLLVAGASYAFAVGASTVAIGLLSKESALFPDQIPDFVEQLETTMRMALAWQIRFATPLGSMSKTEVLELAEFLGLQVEDTYSCHLGEEPCGDCISCRERSSALSLMKES